MNISLGKIAEIIDASLDGDPSKVIHGINALEDAQSNEISYATSRKYSKSLSKTSAGAVILDKNLSELCSSNALVVENAYLAFAKLTHHFKKQQSQLSTQEIQLNIDKAQNIKGVFIGPSCFIGNDVVIGENTIIETNCVIEDGVHIGEGSHISSNVVIQRNCLIGKNCIISSGAIIGSEGFGNARTKMKDWTPIAHLGNVRLGDNVSIGANTTIDRGTIKDTEIHDGVKIDNLVHIAHNVVIGENTAIAAKTGIAGTTTIGKRCMIGGMVGIVGHLIIADDVVINATSTVNRNIAIPGVYTGFVPLMLHSEWKKVGIWITKLDKIAFYLKIKLKNIK
jgi:UDP-3-O-[3-hydroxymyristoyl] glucosamine N-acyltransferase